jgi:hypothetical protein
MSISIAKNYFSLRVVIGAVQLDSAHNVNGALGLGSALSTAQQIGKSANWLQKIVKSRNQPL